METTGIQSTFRVTLPNADARFLKRLSENMGWQAVRVPAAQTPPARKERKTELDLAIEDVRKGNLQTFKSVDALMDYLNS